MKNSHFVVYFDEAAVRNVLRWDALISAMETALADFSRGRVMQPLRNLLEIEEGRRYLGLMPAVAEDFMGVKLVSFFPGNAGTAVPTHLATIVLLRSDTGEPIAAMDGRLITEMRTAAVSAAVTRQLAPPGPWVVALLGSGVQAGAHLEALKAVGRAAEVRVWSPNPEHVARFAAEHHALGMADAESAVRGADIVVTATNAREPVLKGAWLKPGAHVNAIGAARPAWRELDDDAMLGGAVVVDSREAVLEESGDVILSKAEIYAEIGELFAGLKTRPPAGATTIFKSVGLAIEDLAAAKLVYAASP